MHDLSVKDNNLLHHSYAAEFYSVQICNSKIISPTKAHLSRSIPCEALNLLERAPTFSTQ